MKVMVVGGGGREHALAWKIAQSPNVDAVYCAPGNGGTALEPKCSNAAVSAEDVEGLARFARERKVDLVVVGPEVPLALGLVDRLEGLGIPAFGPSREAARLESSKAMAKRLMAQRGVPTAPFEVFDDFGKAQEYILSIGKERGLVVKADGLAAGKGAVVCDGPEDAIKAARSMLVERIFGDAGRVVVVEERLYGREASLLAFTDGRDIRVMPVARDYKRVYDGDLGPNTGGMGSYSPVPDLSEADVEWATKCAIVPIVQAMQEMGTPYRGVIYAGLMFTAEGPFVLEYNVRFGDPETQAILPRLDSDLAEVCFAVARGKLGDVEVRWKDEAAVCVVAASSGYPGSYRTGYEISGLDDLPGSVPGYGSKVMVFHAGTRLGNPAAAGATIAIPPESTSSSALKPGRVLTAGGRVLGVSALGKTLADAAAEAYRAISLIRFEGMHYRRDIAGGASAEPRNFP